MSLTSQRNISNNNSKLQGSMEKVSSGLRINRGSDGPADLIISEKLRGKIASYTQAISNNEISVTMAQTAESALDEVNNGLIRMRQLAIHASNEGANDEDMLNADQLEFDSIVSQIDRIASFTSFGNRKLLDGEHANQGVTRGDGLKFISASTETKSTGEGEYEVAINQTATKTKYTADLGLDEDLIDDGETLKIFESGKTVEYKTQSGDTVSTVVAKLSNLLKAKEMNVEINLEDDEKITVSHKNYGSGNSFKLSSTTAGIFSNDEGQFNEINNGLDVSGTIDGIAAKGKGDVLVGMEGTHIAGLKVKYTNPFGEEISEDYGETVGNVKFEQNSLKFQIASEYGQNVSMSLPGTYAGMLGRHVDNTSEYDNLSNVNLKSFQGSQDGLLIIDKAISEISQARGELGAVQKFTLEANHRYLSSAKENMINAESIIRDTDMAAEISEMTKFNIINQTSTAALSHANKAPQSVLTLLQ